jgi:hypothetical protein
LTLPNGVCISFEVCNTHPHLYITVDNTCDCDTAATGFNWVNDIDNNIVSPHD